MRRRINDDLDLPNVGHRAKLMDLQQITTRDPMVRTIMENRNKKRDQTRNLENVLPDGSWKDQRCFIIGGGPSLTGFDFERLRGERIIAINKAFAYCMFADVLYFMDYIHFYSELKSGKFGGEMLAKWNTFPGIKVFSDSHARNLPDSHWINLAFNPQGVSRSQKRGINRGTNCGYGAINLAVVMGANPIYLLGYDMKHDGKRTHFHDGYWRTAVPMALGEFVAELGGMRCDLNARRIKVVNLNPDSALKWFEFKTIDEVL